MKFKILVILLVVLMVSAPFLNLTLTVKGTATSTLPNLYVGVDVAYENVTATEQLIDKISVYTNIVVIGCTGNYDLYRLTTLSQYAFDKGMSFIIYSDTHRYPTQQWLGTATSNWGNKFLGIYYFDEEGGKQLDQQKYPAVTSAKNYSDAANLFNKTINTWLRGPRSITQSFAYPTQYKLFTSDYAFYWYDYQAGYDTVFAEFGANYSRQLNVALCRGAATAQNKDWGVMITWTYTQPPYIESGPALYNDMVLAYQNGARYIIIFDSNQDYSQTILQQEHLDAMQQFWQYVQNNPRTIAPVSERTTYVLPQNYAYGFRGPQDRIWGLWGPDAITNSICSNVTAALNRYGSNLDIIYPNAPQTIDSIGYQNVTYWNGTPLSQSPDSNQKSLPWLEISIFAIAAGIISIAAAAAMLFKFRRHTENK